MAADRFCGPAEANEGWFPIIRFISKMFVFLFVYIWPRGMLPRQRYYQFMRLGWREPRDSGENSTAA